MSAHSLRYTRDFEKRLRKLDQTIQRRVLAALIALADLPDPPVPLTPLRHSKAGLWRLRVGDFRVIVSVQRHELVIVALDVGHRSVIYDE